MALTFLVHQLNHVFLPLVLVPWSSLRSPSLMSHAVLLLVYKNTVTVRPTFFTSVFFPFSLSKALRTKLPLTMQKTIFVTPVVNQSGKEKVGKVKWEDLWCVGEMLSCRIQQSSQHVLFWWIVTCLLKMEIGFMSSVMWNSSWILKSLQATNLISDQPIGLTVR